MMKLPHRDKAYIPRAKLTDYLLSLTHAVGRSKARFFRSMGYDRENVDLLEEQLLTMARVADVTTVTSSPYGIKYVIDGTLLTPAGGMVRGQTIWILETGNDRPRFVTAYPV